MGCSYLGKCAYRDNEGSYYVFVNKSLNVRATKLSIEEHFRRLMNWRVWE